MVDFEYSKTAFADLRSIKKFISLDSVFYAKRFMLDLTNRIETLIRYPELGRIIYPDRYRMLRQLLFKSYRIIYHYENNKVTVITVHHQSRLLEDMDALKPFEI